MRTALSLAPIGLLLTGCKAADQGSRTAMTGDTTAWSDSFDAPCQLDSGRVHLEPLTPAHADEFDAREAYAYTVLAPERTACLGCVYLDPVEGDPSVRSCRVRSSRFSSTVVSGRAVRLAYWVTEAGVQSGLDEHLFVAVLECPAAPLRPAPSRPSGPWLPGTG